MIGLYGTAAKHGKRRRQGKRNESRERVERGKGERERIRQNKSQAGEHFMFTFDKLFRAYTKESNAVNR